MGLRLCSVRTFSSVAISLLVACKSPRPSPELRIEPRPVARPDVQLAPTPSVIERAPTPEPVLVGSDAAVVAVSERDAAVARDAALEESDAAPTVAAATREDESYSLALRNSLSCDLRVRRGAIAATCTDGTLECTQLATASFTAADSQEVLWDCATREYSQRAVVLSNARDVLWGQLIAENRENPSESCSLERLNVEFVTVAASPTPAMMVRARNCEGDESDAIDFDYLWIWRDGAMREVAATQFRCGFSSTRTGRRIGPVGMVSCIGSYIAANEAGTGVNIVGHRVEVRQNGFGDGRMMKGNGHIQQRIHWSNVLRRDADGPE